MRVIDFGEEPDGLLYIAMEYVEGRDLYRVIHEDWPISNADIGDILMQALAAIAVAHEMGVIHRDLKPENLMMLRAKNDDEKDAYVVKVCDFGIAKITEKDDEPEDRGRPRRPEAHDAGPRRRHARVHVARAGARREARRAVRHLLDGRHPLSAAHRAHAVHRRHARSRSCSSTSPRLPQAPSVHYAGVHKGLEAIALKALAKDRNDRFQSARAMRNAIREALEGRPMPVDIAAATLEAPQSRPGTAPMVVAGGMAPVVARGVTAPGACRRIRAHGRRRHLGEPPHAARNGGRAARPAEEVAHRSSIVARRDRGADSS